MSEKEKTKINSRVFYRIDEGDNRILKKREDEQPAKRDEDRPAYEADWVTFGPGA